MSTASQFTQNKRSIRLHSHLGADVFNVTSAQITETLSSPFSYHFDVFSSQRHDIDAKDIVGTPVSLEIVGDNNALIERSGYVTGFFCTGTSTGKDKTYYTLTVEPWLSLLRDAFNCRIFQNKTIKGVIDALFKKVPEAKWDTKGIKGKHKEREYWVQHNESMLDYFHRICRLEGVAYYFAHKNNQHTLMLVDQALHLPQLPEPNTLTIQSANHDHESLTTWRFQKQFVVGKTVGRSYHYETPSAPLEVKANADDEIIKTPRVSAIESYRYSESYDTSNEGQEEMQRINHQQAAAQHGIWKGEGDYRHLLIGHRFKVNKIPNDSSFADKNDTFNIVKLVLDVNEESGINRVQLQATKGNTLQYPVGGTEKRMMGSETAVVTGVPGSEIDPDEYGRVKVQFHWDREGKHDNNTTCWLRVMQSMAGANYGSYYIPRVGQEVVVHFENGNPDKPFIAGSLYHHEHLPPFAEDRGLRSGFRSHSSKGGGPQDYNEWSFYDKKGSEEVFLQAQKDHNCRIKNDQNTEIGNNSNLKVAKNDNQEIGDTLRVKAGKKIIFEAGQEIQLQVGGSVISITSGDIDLSSGKVDVNGGKILLN